MTDTPHDSDGLTLTTEATDDISAMIAASISGDQSGFTRLYEQFAPGIYRLCYSLLLNRQDAEDVMQEAFVYAFRNLARFDPQRATFKTWLYTITISRCRNAYRRKRLPQINFSTWLNIAAPRSETPEAMMAQRAAQEMLAEALIALSPPLREALVLRYGHGLTYREIADVMNCPPKTAESRVRLAHERLRTSLSRDAQGILEELLSF
jgi:RNA polymerase sigma-70 factor (ECF subfamily)